MARPIPVGEAARAQGYTYIGLLFFIFLAGLGLAVAGHWWQLESRRERETELLFVGDQFRRAIASYYGASPGQAQYPRSLEDLIEDKRHPTPVRHLRRIYRDPMTGKEEWQIIKEQEFVVGVSSKSTEKPIKTAGFALRYKDFSSAATYEQWRFIHRLNPEGSEGKTEDDKLPGGKGAPPPGQPVAQPPVSKAGAQ